MTDSKPAASQRNPGTTRFLERLAGGEAALRGIDRRAAELQALAPVPPAVEAQQLLHAVRLLDLTTLQDDDTDDTVRALCVRALTPVDPELATAVGNADLPVRTAAVCTWDRFVPTAGAELAGSGVRVAAVAAGFPEPHGSRSQRLAEIRSAVRAGADEIDAVITREHVLEREWGALHSEVEDLREASGPAHLKVIVRAGALDALEAVYSASYVCCAAGADFVKSSTGREATNATLPIGLAMTAAIRAYAGHTGYAVGFKPAGGIRSASDALRWLRLVRQELGSDALDPARFRVGASSLLEQIRARLDVLAGSHE